jgi:hypothetical protein
VFGARLRSGFQKVRPGLFQPAGFTGPEPLSADRMVSLLVSVIAVAFLIVRIFSGDVKPES